MADKDDTPESVLNKTFWVTMIGAVLFFAASAFIIF